MEIRKSHTTGTAASSTSTTPSLTPRWLTSVRTENAPGKLSVDEENMLALFERVEREGEGEGERGGFAATLYERAIRRAKMYAAVALIVAALSLPGVDDKVCAVSGAKPWQIVFLKVLIVLALVELFVVSKL